tara:strand:- start:4430 stop:5167 length:738 start_codon:yes stop_codon:yes gene_type:complete
MTKKIISFDIGIKNLAYCIIEKSDENFKILHWDIINILEEKFSNIPKCNNYIKKNKNLQLCNNPAISFIENNNNKLFFCKKITCQKFLKTNYSNLKINLIKKITTKNYSILEMGSSLLKKLNSIKDIILNIDQVIIENQPVLKNPTMKSIQMILYSFFIEYGYNSDQSSINNIILFSARDKLKLYNGPCIDTSKIKNQYNKRKYLSIEYTKYYIKDSEFYEYFINNNKKDDLADSFIQGYYYLYK